MTAPRLSAVQAQQSGFASAHPRLTTTPLYDALVHEYRLALRCVPGDQGTDERAAAVAASSSVSPEFGALPYRRGSGALPRQGSRHRGASGDAPSPAFY